MTPLTTQLAVGIQTGLEDIMCSTVKTYEHSAISIQATNDPPHQVHAHAGTSQGDAKVCSTFPLSTEPAVIKCAARCFKHDPTGMTQAFVQWVDDSFGAAPTLERVLEILTLLSDSLKILGYKLGKIVMACNGPAALFGPKVALFKDTEIPIQGSTHYHYPAAASTM